MTLNQGIQRRMRYALNSRSRVRSRASVVVAVGLAGTIACGTAVTAPQTVTLRVRTDKVAYSLASDQAATPTVLNLGPARVFAPMNEYVYVERFAAGQWGDRHPWFAVDGAGISFPLRAGDSLSAFPMSFAYVARQPGVYRFVFELALDSLGRRLVPEAQRTSPPFELRP